MPHTLLEKHAAHKLGVKSTSLMGERIPMSSYVVVFATLIFANVSIYRSVFASPMLEVHVFTIGKGNAAFVRTLRDKTLLIDTGSDASVLRGLGAVLPMWRRGIDTIILTSADGKSTGGLKEIQSRYETPEPLRFGDSTTPYGTPVTFDTDTRITVIAPHTFSISYGASSFAFSSSTPEGTYRFDGAQVRK